MLVRMPGDTAGGLGTLPEDWPRDTFSRPTNGGKGSASKSLNEESWRQKQRELTSTQGGFPEDAVQVGRPAHNNPPPLALSTPITILTTQYTYTVFRVSDSRIEYPAVSETEVSE